MPILGSVVGCTLPGWFDYTVRFCHKTTGACCQDNNMSMTCPWFTVGQPQANYRQIIVDKTSAPADLNNYSLYYRLVDQNGKNSEYTFPQVLTVDCNTLTTINAPTLPPMNFDFQANVPLYPLGYIQAFTDTYTVLNPGACGKRTCTSDSPYVTWSQIDQKFTVASTGTDVPGDYTVTLTCGLTSYPLVPQTSSSWVLKISASCSTTQLTLGTLATDYFLIDLGAHTQSVPVTYTDTYSTQISTPGICGPLSCTVTPTTIPLFAKIVSQSLNVAPQSLTVQYPVGTHPYQLTCGLQNYSVVPKQTKLFNVNIVKCVFSSVVSTTSSSIITQTVSDPAATFPIDSIISTSPLNCIAYSFTYYLEFDDGTIDFSRFGGTLVAGNPPQLQVFAPTSSFVGTYNLRWYGIPSQNLVQPPVYVPIIVNILPTCTPTPFESVLPDITYNVGSGLKSIQYFEIVNGNCIFATSNNQITPTLPAATFISEQLQLVAGTTRNMTVIKHAQLEIITNDASVEGSYIQTFTYDANNSQKVLKRKIIVIAKCTGGFKNVPNFTQPFVYTQGASALVIPIQGLNATDCNYTFQLQGSQSVQVFNPIFNRTSAYQSTIKQYGYMQIFQSTPVFEAGNHRLTVTATSEIGEIVSFTIDVVFQSACDMNRTGLKITTWITDQNLDSSVRNQISWQPYQPTNPACNVTIQYEVRVNQVYGQENLVAIDVENKQIKFSPTRQQAVFKITIRGQIELSNITQIQDFTVNLIPYLNQSSIQQDKQGDSNEWNWLRQRQQALKNGYNGNILPPDAEITKVNLLGLVTVTFTKKMITPPLKFFKQVAEPKNQTQFETVFEAAAMTVSTIHANNLVKFKYNITKYVNYTMQLQLIFEDAMNVSQNFDYDQLRIQFQPDYFFDTYGISLPQHKITTYKLPSQLQFNTTYTNLLVQATEIAEQATFAIVSGNFVLNILFQAALNQLLSMIRILQIVNLIPLFNIRMPANAAYFFGFILNIVSFDLIPIGNVYDQYFTERDSGLNPNFGQLGIVQSQFIYNLGSLFYTFFLLPIQLVAYYVLKPLQKLKFAQKWRKKIFYSMFWNNIISVTAETFVFVFLCVLINTQDLQFDTAWHISNSTFALIFGIYLVAFALMNCIFIFVNFEKLPQLEQNFGSLFEGLELRRGRKVVWYKALTLFRNMLIPFTVVYNDHLIVQVMAIAYSTVAVVIALGNVHPLEGGVKSQILELFSEYVLMFVLYTFMLFSDYVPDTYTRFQIGYVSIGIVSFYFCVKIALILVDLGKRAFLRLKWYLIRKKKIKAFQRRQTKQGLNQIGQAKVNTESQFKKQDTIQTQDNNACGLIPQLVDSLKVNQQFSQSEAQRDLLLKWENPKRQAIIPKLNDNRPDILNESLVMQIEQQYDQGEVAYNNFRLHRIKLRQKVVIE